MILAQRLKFASPDNGLAHIYNVSARVGAPKSCPNQPDDVQLVQLFLRDLMPVMAKGSSIQQYPTLSGRMDAVTAFWIYHLQNSSGEITTVDGIVSPAQGVGFGQKVWFISGLNYKYNQYFPDRFNKLPENPELSPSLRASLRG